MPPSTPSISDALAFWTLAPGRGAVRPETLRAPADGEVLVDTLFSGISRGTETLVFAGRVPTSQHADMRAPHQTGNFPGPVKYGYSAVGRVRRGPPGLEGHTVFCLFPHQSAFVVPADAVLPLPAGVPAGRAVLAANLETAINVLWDAGIRIGDRVTIVGAGVVGLLIGSLARRIPGTAVTMVDIDPGKAAVTEALGLAFRTPATADGDQDLVVHASASEAGLASALTLAGEDATVVEASWYGDKPVALPLGEAFHSRRLTLRASQVGRVPPSHRHRRSPRQRLTLALALLDDPRFDRLISGECRLTELPETMARLTETPAGTLCHRVRHPAAES